MKYYLAIDIGASSGRHIIGYYDEKGNLITDEMHRFKNGVSEVNGHLTWDIDYLFNEVKKGIAKCLEKYPHIESMSIDTWGVDYVLLDGNDKEIYPVYAYRDARTKKVIPEVHKIIPFERLYELTGSQFQEFNTIYQLYDDKQRGRLEKASSFLHIPEYLMYKLTGVKMKEYTNASTTGMMDIQTNDYCKEIIEKLGFPEKLFAKTYKQGTTVGNFTKEIADEVKGNIRVVLCSTHDTGAAVEGIPMKGNAPYISSGTWSLLGIKVAKGISNKKAMEANYSNEYGPSYIRFQKNIMGLWIIQGLARQMNLDFPTMVIMSKTSDYKELFDVNDPCFLSSLDMKNEIRNYFERKGITPPKEDKDYINTTYRSLADSYRVALNELENITGETFDSLYIVGGGAKNQYLNDLTKEFTGKEVIALPIEATAIGNLLGQIKGE